MNEKESFIIEDLDDFHVVIKADEEWRVRKELEAEVRRIPVVDRVCCSSWLSSWRKIPTAWSRTRISAFTNPFSPIDMVRPLYIYGINQNIQRCSRSHVLITWGIL